MEKTLYIGVMSGTSLDGIDTALVSIDGCDIQSLAHRFYPIPEGLKQQLLDLCSNPSTDLSAIGTLDCQLGHLFADAVNALLKESGYAPQAIRAIGCHGQTVFHQPNGRYPFTTQLGDANVIAVKTGIDTVADFRRKDIALGGQGAPLVPAFHQALFQATDASVVVLNVGGIANISVLRPRHKTLGYDTGPGNVLMDAWCFACKGKRFDDNAAFALQGVVDKSLLNTLLQAPYLSLVAPKSTGREQFNLTWLRAHLKGRQLSAQDVQRTLCEYSAVSIANEVVKYEGSKAIAPQLLVCGGGAKNPLLMRRLSCLLPKWQVASTNTRGVDSDYMEAMAFAWLAQRKIHDLPSNLPEVTGARKVVSLGVVYTAEK